MSVAHRAGSACVAPETADIVERVKTSWRRLAWTGAVLLLIGNFAPLERLTTVPYGDTEVFSLWTTYPGISAFLIVLELISVVFIAKRRPGALWLTVPWLVLATAAGFIGALETKDTAVHADLLVGAFMLPIGAIVLTIAALRADGELRERSRATPPPESEAWLLKGGLDRPPGLHSSSEVGSLTLSEEQLSFSTGSETLFRVPLSEVTGVQCPKPGWPERFRGTTLSLNAIGKPYTFSFVRPSTALEEGLHLLEAGGVHLASHTIFHLLGLFGANLRDKLDEHVEMQQHNWAANTTDRERTAEIANAWRTELTGGRPS